MNMISLKEYYANLYKNELAGVNNANKVCYDKIKDSIRDDSELSALINEFKINEEDLINDASSIRSYLDQKSQCHKCKHIDKCPFIVKGRCLEPAISDNKLVFNYKFCAKGEAKYVFEQNIEKYILKSHLPKKHQMLNFTSIKIQNETQEKLVDFLKKSYLLRDEAVNKLDKSRGFFLSSSLKRETPILGKSYLLGVFVNEIAQLHKTVCFIDCVKFSEEIKKS